MKFSIVILFLLFYFQNFAQLVVDTNFESANVHVLSVNRNQLYFSADYKNRQTENVWFYFKIYNPKHYNQIKLYQIFSKFTYTSKGYVYSFDGQSWYPIKYRAINGNVLEFALPVERADSIYFALSYPYTYSKLLQYLQTLPDSIVTQTSITYSEHNRKVPLLIITSRYSDTSQSKDLIWLIGRQHAFEVPSSYCLEGMIDYFTSNDSLAIALRQKVVIYAVPMVDVDNVSEGKTGRMQKPIDFNRDWADSSYWNAIGAIKDLMQTTADIYNYRLFLDIHSVFPQSTEQNLIYINIYKPRAEQFLNLLDLWNIYEALDKAPVGVNDYSDKNFADLYVQKKYPYLDFSVTIECPWNYLKLGFPLEPKYLRRLGTKLGQAITIYIMQND